MDTMPVDVSTSGSKSMGSLVAVMYDVAVDGHYTYRALILEIEGLQLTDTLTEVRCQQSIPNNKDDVLEREADMKSNMFTTMIPLVTGQELD